MIWLCECGHVKGAHTGSSGPNSIGRWSFGECVAGADVSMPPYRFGGCRCTEYRRRLLPVRKAHDSSTTNKKEINS